jgi:hypothetical protein
MAPPTDQASPPLSHLIERAIVRVLVPHLYIASSSSLASFHTQLLETIDRDLYRSKELWKPSGGRGVFGGQTIAQAAWAATLSVRRDEPGTAKGLHSLHVGPCFDLTIDRLPGLISFLTVLLSLLRKRGHSGSLPSPKASRWTKLLDSHRPRNSAGRPDLYPHLLLLPSGTQATYQSPSNPIVASRSNKGRRQD